MTKTRAVGGSRLPAVLRPAEDLPPAGPGAAGAAPPPPPPAPDRSGGRVDDLLERAPLLGREAREDVVDRVDAGLADAHPQSGESVAVEFLDDRLEGVVPARAARLAGAPP